MSKWISVFALVILTTVVFGQNNALPAGQGKVFVSIDQYIDFAIQNNPAIQQAMINEKVEKQNTNSAISPLLPNAVAVGSINGNLILPSTVLPAALVPVFKESAIQFGNKYNINPSGTVSLNLINAANYETLLISKKNEQIAGANTQLTIEQIKNSLSQAYYLYLLYRRNFEFAMEDMSNADTLLSITQVRYDNQYIDELDLNRSKSSDLQSQNAVDQNKILLQKAMNNLKLLAGLDMSEKVVIEDRLEIHDEGVGEMISTNPFNRPEMQVSMLKVLTNQMAIKRSKLNFSPELTVFGEYGYNAYNNNFDFADASQKWYQNATLGLNLTIPVFSGGIKFFTLQKAKLSQQIAAIDMQNTFITTQKQDQDLLLDYAKAKGDLKVRQEQLYLAERDYKLALVKYRNEYISYDNVINVRNELLAAQEQLIQAQADYVTAQYKIKIINSYDKK